MLEQKIMADYKDAMKQKDAIKSSTLSFLRAELKNIAIDKQTQSLDDSDVITVIKKQTKQRLDSIEKFNAGGRSDLAEKEQKELAVLKSYLPEELTPQQLETIIEEAIAQTQASGPKDMGKVMKEVMAKVAGKAENKIIGELVKAKLSKQ